MMWHGVRSNQPAPQDIFSSSALRAEDSNTTYLALSKNS